MPRGSLVLVRALAVVSAMLLLAQCTSSGAVDSETSEAGDTTEVIEAATDTTAVPAEEATTTTVKASATTVAELTTTSATAATPTSIAEPTTSTTTPAPVIDPNCPTTPHGAVIDRDRQRAWLCDNGVALPEFVVTTAHGQPDPGTYPVFAKSMNASSTLGGHYSTMTHFVAFTRGERTGARVAFHTVPVLRSGEFVQPLESVGTEERFGDSSGCIRVLPEQGQVVWDWLETGDEVRVIT